MTKQDLINLINQEIVENENGDITANDIKTIFTGIVDSMTTIQDQPTFAIMLTQCQAGIPKQFIVLNDEYQDDVDVPYTWTGRILMEYNISKCAVQPTL